METAVLDKEIVASEEGVDIENNNVGNGAAEASQQIETDGAVGVATADAEQPVKIILPYEYGEDEHYYVENLGVVKKKPVYAFFKRAMDMFCALIGLLIAGVPMLIIALIVKCSSKGGAFYKQKRLGLNGKPFYLVKFRTMVADAEKNGAQWSNGDKDPRITKVGSFLRATRLDELPQLWTCFTGKLSIVGPRPERPEASTRALITSLIN